jgi:hypothetical protein
MSSTVKRLAAVAALGATMGIVAPVASASAATTPAAPAGLAFPLPAAGLGGFDPAGFAPVPLSFTGPVLGQVATVIGPTVITTAPGVVFNNTNIQVSAGSSLSGGQVGP